MKCVSRSLLWVCLCVSIAVPGFAFGRPDHQVSVDARFVALADEELSGPGLGVSWQFAAPYLNTWDRLAFLGRMAHQVSVSAGDLDETTSLGASTGVETINEFSVLNRQIALFYGMSLFFYHVQSYTETKSAIAGLTVPYARSHILLGDRRTIRIKHNTIDLFGVMPTAGARIPIVGRLSFITRAQVGLPVNKQALLILVTAGIAYGDAE